MYVNYGTVKDFGDLEKLNISCKGKILVARYGKNFRGNKVCDKFIDINCTVKDDAIHPIHNDVSSLKCLIRLEIMRRYIPSACNALIHA